MKILSTEFDYTNAAQVLIDIGEERSRQDVIWGRQNGHPVELWMAILMEEVGELARSVLEKDKPNYYVEAIQVAAVAAAIAEHKDDVIWRD